MNCFRIGDGGAAEFLDDHKPKILYGKVGVPVVVLRDQSNVAAQPGEDFVMPPREFVRFRALAIEGRNGLFV